MLLVDEDTEFSWENYRLAQDHRLIEDRILLKNLRQGSSEKQNPRLLVSDTGWFSCALSSLRSSGPSVWSRCRPHLSSWIQTDPQPGRTGLRVCTRAMPGSRVDFRLVTFQTSYLLSLHALSVLHPFIHPSSSLSLTSWLLILNIYFVCWGRKS